MAAVLSPAFDLRLKGGHPNYRHWYETVRDRLYEVKDLRNNSVHSGFRLQDVPPEKLRTFEHLTILACPRVQRMAINGLRAGLRSAQELFEYAAVVLEGIPHVVDDVHGTIIFTLEDPSRMSRLSS
jgi:hypothetical protein